MHSYTNRLSKETSPYLLQHAHNPVDWFPWSEEAFEKARLEDKPVLVSIGYAACHWCHVMERESFEDPEVASLMNEHFVNIKVDREERPDVDHIYMDAVQAMTGSGGWPLNVFLMPDRRPFYGGTYFPPRKAFNRSSWTDVLLSMSQTYKERREEVEQQATHLTEHLETSNSFGNAPADKQVFDQTRFDEAFANIMKTADKVWGGFGRAPKFPQTFTIHYLLEYAQQKKNDEALNQALLSLDKMLQGGIYDQIGGGFARYSTDAEWLVPHFEKMLYDNALMVSVLARSFQITKNKIYREIIEETLAFTERELMDKAGGFFSALDADSEGEEGKFYVWENEEVNEILKEDAEIFSNYFDIRPGGNWEGKSIPWIKEALEIFAAKNNKEVAELESVIRKGKKKLLDKRSERVRPQLDDKVLLGWNGLMNAAYCKAFAATGNEHFKNIAVRNMNFLLNAFQGENGLLNHTWKNGQSKYPAFLDDYSHLIAALIELAQITADYSYFDKAAELTGVVLDQFTIQGSSFFAYTYKGQEDMLIRKKEIYDSATPSGNSVMAHNLYRLSIVFNKPEWRRRAEEMLLAIGEIIIKYPTSFGNWLALFFETLSGTNEIVIIGKDWKKYLGKTLGMFISHKLIMASSGPNPRYPLLADKAELSEILIYLCQNYSCKRPVNTIEELVGLLDPNNLSNSTITNT